MALAFICIEKNFSAYTKFKYGGFTVQVGSINLRGSAWLSVWTPEGELVTQPGFVLGLSGAAYVYPGGGEPQFSAKLTAVGENHIGDAMVKFATLRLCAYVDDAVVEPPAPTPVPGPAPGPEIIECVFPAMSLNFISVMSGLASWIGCILRNIITILKWFVDWVLHFPDHLDAWVSRLFGVDPSLPFFDEVMKKIDIWISGKFGVDPEKPFWEELVKKALAWIAEVINTSAQNRIQERKW